MAEPGQTPSSTDLPGSVLFACSHNAIRSPMAMALMRYLHGKRVYVDSVGLRTLPVDPFAVSVLDEIGIDLSGHQPKSFDQLDDDFFDLVVSLSPEAQHRAVEMTRTSSCEIEFWPTMDPSVATGNREMRLDAYRSLRDQLLDRIQARFPRPGGPVMV
ncbi:MAG: low molecular weight phosphatase family protein [Alphaproteobacteria bacterium]|nr:low molecular weight phosphatase family protein [Alphaproteobacteria bacterium]